MGALGSFLVFVGSIGVLVALVCLIRPIAKIGLGTRGRAVMALVAMFVVTGVGGAMMPKAPGAAPAEQAAKTEPTPAEIKVEVQTTWQGLLAAVAECDAASEAVGKKADADAAAYALYPVLKKAADSCGIASIEIGDVKAPPSIKGDLKKKFKDVLETCSNVYTIRGSAFKQMAKVANGDGRPSDLASASSQLDRANAGHVSCVAGYMSAALEAGVAVEDLDPAKKKG